MTDLRDSIKKGLYILRYNTTDEPIRLIGALLNISGRNRPAEVEHAKPFLLKWHAINLYSRNLLKCILYDTIIPNINFRGF